jgi:tetratricopeptide (TPR) repeat protein
VVNADGAQGYLAQARYYEAIGNRDEAMAHYTTAGNAKTGQREKYRAAIGLAQRAIELDPSSLVAHVALGAVRWEAKEYADALSQCFNPRSLAIGRIVPDGPEVSPRLLDSR